jgi:hypothetical protein
MKQALLVLSFALALAIVGTLATAEEDQTWFDLENCSFCKHLGAEKGLMESVRWETHLTDNGVVILTLVPAVHEEAFQRAEKHMQETAAKMGSGEPMHTCGFCQSYGALMMAGVQIENFTGDVARVTLMTSSDESVVKMIHAHAQRTIDEHGKWLAEAKG